MGYFSIVEPGDLGLSTFYFLIATKWESDRFESELVQFMIDHPHIDLFQQSLGEWDYQALVQVHSPKEAQALSQSISTRFGGAIASLLVLPCFTTLKMSLCPFRWGGPQ